MLVWLLYWYTEHNRAEIGYAMNDDRYKQKGYTSEVLPVVLRYGFKEMNLNRVEALISEYNEPSKRLLEKNGFAFEGRLRGHYPVEGVYEDSLLYGLVKNL